MQQPEIVYCERANGKQEFYTFSDRRRWYLTRRQALDLLAKGFLFRKI